MLLAVGGVVAVNNGNLAQPLLSAEAEKADVEKGIGVNGVNGVNGNRNDGVNGRK